MSWSSEIVVLLSAGCVSNAADAVAAVGVSSSTSLRLTNRYFGYPFKLLARRTRFLREFPNTKMADQAPDHGVIPPSSHNVPHFLRDAEAFLGLTPRRFLAMPMPYLRAVPKARTLVIGAPWPLID